MGKKINVTIWNEFRHEKTNEAAKSIQKDMPSDMLHAFVEKLNGFETELHKIADIFLNDYTVLTRLKGVGILTPEEARFSAISSARLVMRDILTPAEGCSSYLVTAGPRDISIMRVCTPKDCSVSTRRCAFWRSSSGDTPPGLPTGSRSSETEGS